MWTQSGLPARNGGWTHRLAPGTVPAADPSQVVPEKEYLDTETLTNVMADSWRLLATDALVRLAGSLGLSVDSLRAFNIGWLPDARRAFWTPPGWPFPMRDARGKIIGIQIRKPDGDKHIVRGSRTGLFLPNGLWKSPVPKDGRLYIAEGLTDACALFTLGFVHVAGRPSCTGGTQLLVELVRRLKRPPVVIVGDNDPHGHGQRGAERLRHTLAAQTEIVQVIHPPQNHKDMRVWLQAGCTANDINAAVANAPCKRRLTIA